MFIEQCFSANYGGLGRCVGNLVPRPLQGREEERPLKRGWGMRWMGGNVEATISLGTLRSDNGDVNEGVTEK